MKTTRREFLELGALAAMGAASGCCASSCGKSVAINGIRIGVQMWSINDLWKDKPAEAFRRLKALGYDGVQSVNFFFMKPDELEKMLGDNGLQIVDMPFRRTFVTPEKFNEYVEFCQRFKVDFVFQPREKAKSAEEWRKHSEWLRELGEKFKPYGIRVGYHNHQHEFLERYDGKRPIDFLYEAGIPMELDVGHIKLAKDDPIAWLNRLDGRVPSIHAKPGGGDSIGGPGDANDWKAIFSTSAAIGTKWAVVECETRRNTYEDIETSMAYLRKLS